MRDAVLGLFVAGLTVAPAFAAPADGPRPVVIAYVFPQDQVVDPASIAAEKLTHINYAFANIADGVVVEGFKRDAENLAILGGLRARNPRLSILVSVGGWTWSGAFSDAARTAESRRRFVESAVAFVRRHGLDGFDVDWEYPGLPGNGNVHRPEDRENFTALMRELRAALDDAGRTAGRTFLLTLAAGAFTDFLDHTEMAEVARVADFVNLMTYDFREAEGDPEAGHHANLYPNSRDAKRLSVDRAVREFRAASVPAAKLVVGVPFYGRAWGQVQVATDGRALYQPGGKVGVPLETRYDRLPTAPGRGYVRRWDPEAQAPYLWNAAERVFVSYDDPESLRLKCRYVLDHGLAGVMFWEYFADRSGALLDALFQGLHARTVRPSR